ncbi:ABC transporter ATP-binding protein [Bauldia sp.]|uniref:ABC transporter ATP-binding protein n=1 Tax=Bauldia sp. TaxID=2575872 RepID=UPI003BAA32B0
MVRLEAVAKSFGPLEVLRDIDLAVDRGEFVVFVGPSGSGKSTLLRLIAGLEDATGGAIFIDGTDVTFAEPSDRGIAMVFQSYALYPHMNVFGNMAFNLQLARFNKSRIRERVAEAAQILRLEDLLERRPGQLSGGQRQRVAIGRAIVRHPNVFLFDEPLSNLDAALRVQMRLEIDRLHRELGTTMIYVTHDQVEAMTLADRIVALDAGRIQQVGKPLELYHHPANRFVAEFIGSPKMNILPADSVGNGSVREAAAVGVRPEHLAIGDPHRGANDDDRIVIPARTRAVERLGNINYGYFEGRGESQLVAQVVGEIAVNPGDPVDLTFSDKNIHLFAPDGRTLRSPIPGAHQSETQTGRDS